jgi:hypothetical protein
MLSEAKHLAWNYFVQSNKESHAKPQSSQRLENYLLRSLRLCENQNIISHKVYFTRNENRSCDT